MKATKKIMIKNIITYSNDGRISLADLYKSHVFLVNTGRFKLEELLLQKVKIKKEELSLPVNCLKTIKKGKALWIISGIHGEEPAGPNSIAKNIKIFLELSRKKIPLILLPLCNPAGYFRNWRYFNTPEYNKNLEGQSIGDSEHLLPDKSGRARRSEPSSNECDIFTKKILRLSKEYPPFLVLDFHEDNLSDKGYIYSGFPAEKYSPAANKIIDLFKENNFPVQYYGKTRFGEEIKKGIVSATEDGSVDELLRTKKILIKGIYNEGPSAKEVFVIETGAKNISLRKRINMQSQILKNLYILWNKSLKS